MCIHRAHGLALFPDNRQTLDAVRSKPLNPTLFHMCISSTLDSHFGNSSSISVAFPQLCFFFSFSFSLLSTFFIESTHSLIFSISLSLSTYKHTVLSSRASVFHRCYWFLPFLTLLNPEVCGLTVDTVARREFKTCLKKQRDAADFHTCNV